MRDKSQNIPFHFPRVILGLLWVLLLAQTVACKSDEPKYPSSQAQRATSGLEGSQAPKKGGPKGLGERCATVKDCPSFLSCLDGACVMPPSLSDSASEKTPTIEILGPEDASIATFKLELAISPDEHAKGLMYRRELPDDWGMLFIYPDDGMRSFWMQNTYIPLDMIFINASGRVVHFLENVEPLTRTPRESKHFARYVLELRGGRAAEVGLKVDHRVQLTDVALIYDVKKQ